MKTPDEIKKELERCTTYICGFPYCEGCLYGIDAEKVESDCVDALLKDALAYIQQLEAAQQKWISVDERLPDNEQDVIICAKRRHYSDTSRFIYIIAKAFYTDGKHDTEHTAYVWSDDFVDMEYDEKNDAYKIPEGWWESVEYEDEFCAVSDFVTHWMPLPEPLKEDCNEQ